MIKPKAHDQIYQGLPDWESIQRRNDSKGDSTLGNHEKLAKSRLGSEQMDKYRGKIDFSALSPPSASSH